MIRELKGKAVKLQEGELLRREEANRQYLMKLENRYLLRNYMLEAGRVSGFKGISYGILVFVIGPYPVFHPDFCGRSQNERYQDGSRMCGRYRHE